ncbi:unnamed protein product [Mucor hiemalis]
MTIESQSNGTKGGRFRTANYQYPVTNFNDKLMEVVREEEEESRTHPNLDMFLSADRISMFDKSKDQFFSSSSYSEDEESDDGDLFSSSLCPMSSPERVLTRQSIFDDKPMNSPPPIHLNRKSIFDEDDDDEEEEEDEGVETCVNPFEFDDDVHDPSSSWLAQIFTDSSSNNSSLNSNNSSKSSLLFEELEQEQDDEIENRAPRMWNRHKEAIPEKKTRRTLPHEEDNNANERLPLREIRFEDYLSDDELPAKKKLVLGNGKAHKMRFMRTLSPPRYAKRKGKEPAENIIPFTM